MAAVLYRESTMRTRTFSLPTFAGVVGGVFALNWFPNQASAQKPGAADPAPVATLASQATITLPPLAFTGDLLYRHEWLGSEGAAFRSAHQHRIRARLGAKAALPSNTEIELRLATGTGRTSTREPPCAVPRSRKPCGWRCQ